jgi:hypothetical protein
MGGFEKRKVSYRVKSGGAVRGILSASNFVCCASIKLLELRQLALLLLLGMKRLYPMSIAAAVATFVTSVAALTLDKSLPYRIGIIDYNTYLWLGRLVVISIALAVLAFTSGMAVRKGWFPPVLAVFGLAPLLLIGGPHSGPNPQFWCFGNLRQIEGAKGQLAQERGLTNGSPIKAADIARFIPPGREPRCANHGTYIINSIGTDARCTVHGTIPEMEASWQKAMAVQVDAAANRSRLVQPGPNSFSPERKR